MAKNLSTIDSMIASEMKKLEKLEAKQLDTNKKIKVCKTNISNYTMMKNNHQFGSLANALEGKGISFEDIIAAVSAGDLLALQEKIEHLSDEVVEGEVATESEV